jgi:hypothetical protein
MTTGKQMVFCQTSVRMPYMKVRFTKETPTQHSFEIVRADGSKETSILETRSFMPHDLIHLAYESTAGKKDSFFGKLASGWSFADLNDRTMMNDPKLADSEMIETERITGPLSSFLTKGVSEESFMQGLYNIYSALERDIPEEITSQLLRDIQASYRSLIGEWNSLPHHKVMEVEWAEK